MSKIRVYELAKEAGIPGKELVDRLLDLGYDIKSHSSSIEDAVADEIRRKVLGTAHTEVTEKRISGEGRKTVIRRRTKTVLSEPEPQPTEEAAEDTAEAEPTAETTAVETAELEPTVQSGEDSPPEAPAATPIAEPQDTAVEGQPVETAATPATSPGLEEPDQKPETEAVGAPAGTEAQPQVESPLEEKPTKPAAQRKGLAKVIKRAAIILPKEEEDRGKKSTRFTPLKAQVAGTKEPARTDFVALAAEDSESAARKKKGKRLVQIQPDADARDRFKRPMAGKRKGRIGFSADDDGETGRLRRRGPKSKAEAKKLAEEAAIVPGETKAIKKRIKVFESISVGDLAHRMSVKVSQVIAKLMELGIMATVNQALDVDTATLVATDFGYEIEQGVTQEQTVLELEEQEGGGELLPRPPVVTVMGHVDHGKTSILDAIRKTDVALGEAGGITQHIGAYYVHSNVGDVVFLDTPGHAAFTEMRSRGAQVTDVVVLVVAADDGVMDQTKEAINHAQAAKVPIVVAVNKIDKPNANPDRVMRELAEHGLVPESWGGEVIYCETSAKQNIGIEELLSNILLQAEVLELKADPARKARGHVVEAQLHKGRGPVATVLIQEGTLRPGDPFVVGHHYGKVRSLTNDKGEMIKEATPSMPVEVQGLSGVPQAGDEFNVVSDEKMAKNVSASRLLKARESELAATTKISLDKLFEQMKEGEVKELRVVLKADVQGSLEAFGQALEQLSTAEIKVRVLHEGTGALTDSDVLLASASDAIIICFNVRPPTKVKELAEKEKVDIRFYDVIYHALDDIRKAMVGMLEPEFKEKVIGMAEVRQTFQVPKIGMVAGSYVTEGKIERNAKARVLRDGIVIYTGSLASLRRFKDDVKEVASGYECGIGIENFNDIKVGDLIEFFVMEEIEVSL